MIKKLSLYDLENKRYRCDDFTRNKHIRHLNSFKTYKEQWEYVRLFKEDFYQIDFKK